MNILDTIITMKRVIERQSGQRVWRIGLGLELYKAIEREVAEVRGYSSELTFEVPELRGIALSRVTQPWWLSFEVGS